MPSRHNLVILKGTVLPLGKRADGTERKNPIIKEDAYGNAFATVVIHTVHDLRKAGSVEKETKNETICICTGHPEAVEFIRKLQYMDIIEVKGFLVTENKYLRYRCACGHINYIPVIDTYVCPDPDDARSLALVDMREDMTDATRRLHDFMKTSNYVEVMGRCCDEHFNDISSEKGDIANYQLKVSRPYFVPWAYQGDRVDYPWIKSYGKIAVKDKYAIRSSKEGDTGTEVFVHGTLRHRSFPQSYACGECDARYIKSMEKRHPGEPISFGDAEQGCGKTFVYNRQDTEIVAYSVEYVQDYTPFPKKDADNFEEIGNRRDSVEDISDNIVNNYGNESAEDYLKRQNTAIFGEQ